MARKTEFGTGPLFTVANTVYGVLVCHMLLVVANLPLVLSPLYVPLFAGTPAAPALLLLACIPVGPSVVAAAYSSNRLIAGKEGHLPKMFVRSLAANAREACTIWLPALGLLAIVAFNLLNLGTTSTPAEPALRAGLLVLALLVCTITANALLIVSRFSFRTVDVVRLAVSCLGAQKRVSLGNAAVLFLCGWALMQTSVFLLLFIGGAVVYLLCVNSRSMLRFIEERFTTAE